MATEQHPHPEHGADAKAPAAPAFAGAARRRFAKAGAAAVGAALTLKSQPGMACSICRTPSAMCSTGFDSHQPIGIVCQGLSPGYWAQHPESWPSTCLSTTYFQKKFTCPSTSPFYNKKMILICSPQSYDKNNVAMHIVAAYMNALTGRTSFLTTIMVQKIWTQYWNTGGPGVGYYQPTGTSGPKWYGAAIVSYLFGTMD